MIPTILQILVLSAYLIFLERKFEHLESISGSTYVLDRDKRAIFTGVLWIIGILNFFQPLELWSAFAGGLLCMTGVTITFRSSAAHTNIVHYASASLAIVVTFVGLWIEFDMWYAGTGAFLMSLSLLAIPTKRPIWWVEIISFGWIMGAYFFINWK